MSGLGLRVTHCAPNGGKIIGLQCRICIAFGREEKVGAKRKPASAIQAWTGSFRYDNIESHVRGQHPSKWAEYRLLESHADRNAFLDDVPTAFKNNIKAHFPSLSFGAERQIVFDIEKDIVDVIVGDRCSTRLMSSTVILTMMWRRNLHSVVRLSGMLFSANVFERHCWRKSEHCLYSSTSIRRTATAIFTQSRSTSRKQLCFTCLRYVSCGDSF